MSTKKHKHPKITFNDSKRDYDKISRFKEKDEEKDEKPCFISHLQPEVLPLELMKTLLVTRGAGEDILKDKSLEGIIQLFYKHITPKPQRIYRQNRRGKELSKNRGKCVNKQDFQKDYKILETSKYSSSNVAKVARESNVEATETSRLKRPVICVDSEKKKIKLSSSSSSLDSIKIIDRSQKTKITSSTNSDKELKRSETESSKSSTVVESKKIKLDREGSSSSSTSIASKPSSDITSSKNSDKELKKQETESSESSTVVESKKIKLDREGSSSSSTSIASKPSSDITSSKNSDKELKRSETESSESSTVVVVNKKIKLDREGSSSSSTSIASKPSSDTKEEKPKKKLISWP